MAKRNDGGGPAVGIFEGFQGVDGYGSRGNNFVMICQLIIISHIVL